MGVIVEADQASPYPGLDDGLAHIDGGRAKYGVDDHLSNSRMIVRP